MFESPQFIASGNEVFIRASQTRDFDSNATSDILNISVFGVVDNRWQKLFKLEDFATLIGLTSSLVRVNGNLISITTDRGQHWSVLEPPSGARLKVFGSGNTLIATYNDGNSHIYYRDLSTAEWVQAKDLLPGLSIQDVVISGDRISIRSDVGGFTAKFASSAPFEAISNVLPRGFGRALGFKDRLLLQASSGVYQESATHTWLRLPIPGSISNVVNLRDDTLIAYGRHGLFSSADKGTTWLSWKMPDGVLIDQLLGANNSLYGLATHGLDLDRSVYRITDQGRTWTKLASLEALHFSVRSFAVDSNESVYIINGLQLFKSSSPGGWTNITSMSFGRTLRGR